MGNRIRYQLEITATYEESGDYMRNANLEDFLEWAQDETRYLTIMVKRGAGQPKPLRASIKVTQVAAVLDAH